MKKPICIGVFDFVSNPHGRNPVRQLQDTKKAGKCPLQCGCDLLALIDVDVMLVGCTCVSGLWSQQLVVFGVLDDRGCPT